MDNQSTAELARHILATAFHADLLLIGTVRGSQTAHLFADDAGVPRLSCGSRSDAATAARLGEPAVLTVADHRHRTPIRLMIAGRLRHLGTFDGDPEADLIALEPRRVEIEDGRRPDDVGIAVNMHDYVAVSPDALTVYAAKAVIHTNERHGDELRRYISIRYSLPETVIAGALLSRLDERGAVLRWVDAVGAHVCEINFPAPAHDPCDLARMLRQQLGSA
jgi:hypothetical protein